MLKNKKSILSTKSLGESLINEAFSNNVSIDVCSFIETEPISTIEVQREIEQALLQSAVVVFTSTNSVEAVATKLHQQIPLWTVFCIGHATKEAVVKYFGEKSVAGVADNAKQLANKIIHGDFSDVLFFCGDKRRDELPALLTENNINVREVVVYKTVATPGKIEKRYDGILFFSPSGVKSFFQNNKLDDQTILFAIGRTTADELKKFSGNQIVISDTPETKMLLQKAIAVFETNHIHH